MKITHVIKIILVSLMCFISNIPLMFAQPNNEVKNISPTTHAEQTKKDVEKELKLPNKNTDAQAKEFDKAILKNQQDIFMRFGDAFAGIIQKNFPGHIIINVCLGSFVNDAANEYAAILYHPKSKLIKLAVVLENSQVSEVRQYHKELKSLGGDGEIQCLSAMEAKRRDRDIKANEIVGGRIAPISPLDILCHFEDATTAKCWGYAPKDKKWKSIGGWET